MGHATAIQIFEEIRNRPYAWSSELGVPAHNCYFKGIELLQRLGAIGYTVRGRVGEALLDKHIPEHIHHLYPKQFLLTHFYVEILLDNLWQIIDPSYDPPLAKHGFIVNNWHSNQSCLQITRLYTHEEQMNYVQEWHNLDYAQRYFNAIKPCSLAINDYLEQLRKSGAE